jgi:hypothetical protein
MLLGVRIISPDIIPNNGDVLLNEYYYMNISPMNPGDTKRTITLTVKHEDGSTGMYSFLYNIVNCGDEFDFESRFRLNCCL